ncbi:MAG: hypothetical protein QM802_08020 [Agriterribacter sp.]
MKFTPLLILVVVLSISVACKKNAQRKIEPGHYILSVNECANPVIADDQLNICFDESVAECRCPEGAECIWAGYASGRFSFTKDGHTDSFILSIPTLTRDTIISGYKIELIDITPHPTTSPQAFTVTKRKAELRITRQ